MLEPTWYVIAMPVDTLDGRLEGRTLCLSLTLLRIWNEKELRAAVAHELAHFRGADSSYSGEFVPAVRSAVRGWYALRPAIGRDARLGAALLLLPLIRFTVERFAIAVVRHARQREFVADRVAADAVGPFPIATALVKTAIAVPVWAVHLRYLVEEPDAKLEQVSAAVAWLANAFCDAPFPPQWLAPDDTFHPIDTHPPLGDRLHALNLVFPEAWVATFVPDYPAVELVPDADVIDTRLSQELSKVAEAVRRVRGTAPHSEEGSAEHA
ncbi:MAG: M48 family metalloprotease [Thermomicrobium sp.]|nr:M48 family metalloprotease [Thermomicrobium sp.]